jgi:hypothetical protein
LGRLRMTAPTSWLALADGLLGLVALAAAVVFVL